MNRTTSILIGIVALVVIIAAFVIAANRSDTTTTTTETSQDYGTGGSATVPSDSVDTATPGETDGTSSGLLTSPASMSPSNSATPGMTGEEQP